MPQNLRPASRAKTLTDPILYRRQQLHDLRKAHDLLKDCWLRATTQVPPDLSDADLVDQADDLLISAIHAFKSPSASGNT